MLDTFGNNIRNNGEDEATAAWYLLSVRARRI